MKKATGKSKMQKKGSAKIEYIPPPPGKAVIKEEEEVDPLEGLEGLERENMKYMQKLVGESSYIESNAPAKKARGKSSSRMDEQRGKNIPKDMYEKYKLMKIGIPKVKKMVKDIDLNELPSSQITCISTYENGYIKGLQFFYNEKKFEGYVVGYNNFFTVKTLNLRGGEEIEAVSLIYQLDLIQHITFHTTEGRKLDAGQDIQGTPDIYQLPGHTIKMIYHGYDDRGCCFLSFIFGPPQTHIRGENEEQKISAMQPEIQEIMMWPERTGYIGSLLHRDTEFDLNFDSDLRAGALIGIKNVFLYVKNKILRGMEVHYYKKKYKEKQEIVVRKYISGADHDIYELKLEKFEVILSVKGLQHNQNIVYLDMLTSNGQKLSFGEGFDSIEEYMSKGEGIKFEFDTKGREIIGFGGGFRTPGDGLISRLYAYYYDC